MGGYIFTVGGDKPRDAIREAMRSGAFGVVADSDSYNVLWDYLSMRRGDWVFFFSKRLIRGAGQLIAGPGERPVIENWPDATAGASERKPVIPRPPKSGGIPWIVWFHPIAGSDDVGVDMDELLQSDAAAVARGLRSFSGVSFLKVEDPEAEAIANAILLRTAAPGAPLVDTPFQRRKAPRLPALDIDLDALVASHVRRPTKGPYAGKVRLTAESILQCVLVDAIARRDPKVVEIFGDWAHVVSQEPASPYKPRVYMDKIDVFGYEAKVLRPGLPAVVTRYKVVEVKKDPISVDDGTVEQVLKYVDWIAHSRAGGDYELIDAYIVAPDFEASLTTAGTTPTRQYVTSRRPYETREWSRLTLVRADFPVVGGVEFTRLGDPPRTRPGSPPAP